MFLSRILGIRAKRPNNTNKTDNTHDCCLKLLKHREELKVCHFTSAASLEYLHNMLQYPLANNTETAPISNSHLLIDLTQDCIDRSQRSIINYQRATAPKRKV